MITKRYQLVNNIGGWFVFAIALLTYWLTLEPTASYWDCGEFIIQADKLEVGHPPGNPIFMLTARFFANFAPSAQYVSVMVNAMSGLLSALTILLLFWTITHLTRRLIVKDDHTGELPIAKMTAIMGSGLVGALAYCWSDTFWFSAVEGEVYAFSSFCTALVFWLILKWENRADDPHSDRYLILIAYIIGVSVAVHLLNLLCIPAIVLVFCYRKFKDMNLVKSLIALVVSFAIIVLVLYGLVPGFIKVAQQFELFFVNTCHMSFNSGALIYAVVTVAIFAWALYSLYTEKSANAIRISIMCAAAVSGIFWIGSVWTAVLLLAALAAVLWIRFRTLLPARVLSVVMWSVAVIFVGYSSYALILIRSTADTPMNQNSPDNVFDLASYLNREQYGENPLLYGETLYSAPMKEVAGVYVDSVAQREDGSWVTLMTPYYNPVINPGKALYAKGVKGAQPSSEYGFLNEDEKSHNAALAQRDGDYYVKRDYKPETKMNPELNMLFPRIYSRQHRDLYTNWVRLDTMPGNLVSIEAYDPQSKSKIPELDTQVQPVYNEYTGTLAYPQKMVFKPSFPQNLAYFFNYQLSHMYMRYFMWNFAGRQNDINNQMGEIDAGNWISGIPFIDNARLGDQSLLPNDLGKGNAGHNVYYMLPLILGLIGLIWQAFEEKRGIEQFWVVFFLFFMTGIAIVLYLNQPPGQPRERDYAFAGSFYAFAIWIGMGVAALWRFLLRTRLKPSYCAAVATLLGLVVPVQMVSQTWDDHDRSGRYAARDFAINYLESLEPNAIVFCNGDNDTFPLWYAQEVEGVRPDVKIINLSYLNSDWYANQQRMQSYEAEPVHFTAKPEDYAYGRADVTVLGRDNTPADLLQSLKYIYDGGGKSEASPYASFPSSVVKIPVDRATVLKRGLVTPADTARVVDNIIIDLSQAPAYRQKGYISLGELLMLDIIATNAADGWKRPIYWASTVGTEYHLGLTPYLRSTGMTHQLVPTIQGEIPSRTDRAYDVITKKYRWGGADVAPDKAPYFDETARRMLVSMRTSMVDLASELVYEGDMMRADGDVKGAEDKYRKALEVVNLLETRLPESTSPYTVSVALTAAQIYCELGQKDYLNDRKLTDKGLKQILGLMDRFGAYVAYNRAMALSYGQPALTYESQLLPYQYYRFIELYKEYGGDMARVKPILDRWHLSESELQQYYNSYTSRGAEPAGDESGYTMEQLTEEIAKYCEVAVEMASLSPSDYAARSDEEKMIDTMLYTFVDYYLEKGGKEEDLAKYPNYKAVDWERAKRLSEQTGIAR